MKERLKKDGRSAEDGGRSRCRKSPGYVGYKVRRKGVVFVVYILRQHVYILRHETEGIVGRDRRRVEAKVEKIKTDGNKEKIQINMIMYIVHRWEDGSASGKPDMIETTKTHQIAHILKPNRTRNVQ